MKDAYRIENVEGCIVIYGAIPMSKMASVLGKLDKSAVMSNEMQNILGATLVAGTPADLEKLMAASRKPSVPLELHGTLSPGARSWVESGKVGLSSNFMLFTFTGFNALGWLKHKNHTQPVRISHPEDPDDLSRCRRLLDAAPELAGRIQEMGATSEVWKSLAANWSALCTLMDLEAPDWRSGEGAAPKTYALMRKLIAESPLEVDADSKLRDRRGS